MLIGDREVLDAVSPLVFAAFGPPLADLTERVQRMQAHQERHDYWNAMSEAYGIITKYRGFLSSMPVEMEIFRTFHEGIKQLNQSRFRRINPLYYDALKMAKEVDRISVEVFGKSYLERIATEE